MNLFTRMLRKLIGPRCPYDKGKLYDYYGQGKSLKCPNCPRTYVWNGKYLIERGDKG